MIIGMDVEFQYASGQHDDNGMACRPTNGLFINAIGIEKQKLY